MDNAKKYSEVGVLILSGGVSSRQGSPKALLPHPAGGTFIGHLARAYAADLDSVPVVVMNSKILDEAGNELSRENSKVVLISNSDPERGRFYSVKLGFKVLQHCDFVIIHPVDNPEVVTGLTKNLAVACPAIGYSVPVYKGKGGHPVCLSKYVVNALLDKPDVSNLRQLLGAFEREEVAAGSEVLLNIDTPGLYQQYVQESSLQTAEFR
jgi:CTP:molybdopterin cytidylyltransferase MocA